MNATTPGLSADQKEFFDREGYLVVEDVLDPARDFRLLIKEHGTILNGLARARGEAGQLADFDPDAPFERRVLDFAQATGAFPIQNFDISLPQKGISTKTPIYLGAGAFSVITHPELLDLVEAVIGPDITVSPVQHIRIKTPLDLDNDTGDWNGAPQATLTTPAHQDIGVQTADADASEVLTVWMPITDASEEMGCLGVWPRRHRDGILDHCPGDEGLAITPRSLDLEDLVPVPMRAGSVLLMSRYTPHRALPNHSRKVRWSMDLRYQPSGQVSGRAAFPDFVARSRAHPESRLNNHRLWRDLWLESRDRLSGQPAPAYNRWSADAPWCA
jgi:phytanoyl-CoA hydroxylase